MIILRFLICIRAFHSIFLKRNVQCQAPFLTLLSSSVVHLSDTLSLLEINYFRVFFLSFFKQKCNIP